MFKRSVKILDYQYQINLIILCVYLYFCKRLNMLIKHNWMGKMIKQIMLVACLALMMNLGNIHADQSPENYHCGSTNIQTSQLDIDLIYEDKYQENIKRYKNALMSYLTERHKLSSSYQDKQEIIDQQLNELSDHGIALIESEEQIPKEIRRYFTEIAENGKDKMAQLYFDDVGLSVRTFIDTQNQKIYISFRGADFSNLKSIKSSKSIAYPSVQPVTNESSYCNLIPPSEITYDSEECSVDREGEKTGYICIMPPIFERGQEITTAFKNHYPGFLIHLIGYSQGGAVALHMAINTDDIEEAYIFNSQIPSPCLIHGACKERIKRVFSTYVENDMLNDAYYSLFAMATRFFLHQGTEPFQSTKLFVDPTLDERILYTYNEAPWHNLSFYQQGMSFLIHGFIRHSPAAVLEATRYYCYTDY